MVSGSGANDEREKQSKTGSASRGANMGLSQFVLAYIGQEKLMRGNVRNSVVKESSKVRNSIEGVVF